MNFTPRKADDDATTTVKLPQYELVEKYMATDLITFNLDNNMAEVIEKMVRYKISGASVVDENNRLVGVISEIDCMRLMIDSAYHNLPLRDKHVKDYMTKVIKTVTPYMNILDVAGEFVKTNLRRFPVISNGKLVGQISRHDVLKAANKMKKTTWGK
ncbi:CBS domain-containing protein [Flammeovirgaceae bacterium SG7u.111]|nr:CBS domain-containing protein [Flammeovirgaceae bacterium SG7u.132]WPO38296.1 CBS domain-containing protein [Flammeovirgaceae bacterium SG7u.111]